MLGQSTVVRGHNHVKGSSWVDEEEINGGASRNPSNA